MPFDRFFMPLISEKIIQISDHRILTNKGRLFEEYQGYNGPTWIQIKPPDFAKEFPTDIPKGKTKFIESVSSEEKFKKAKNINDLLQ